MSVRDSESMTDPVLLAPTAAIFSGATTDVDLSGRGITGMQLSSRLRLQKVTKHVMHLATFRDCFSGSYFRNKLLACAE